MLRTTACVSLISLVRHVRRTSLSEVVDWIFQDPFSLCGARSCKAAMIRRVHCRFSCDISGGRRDTFCPRDDTDFNLRDAGQPTLDGPPRAERTWQPADRRLDDR